MSADFSSSVDTPKSSDAYSYSQKEMTKPKNTLRKIQEVERIIFLTGTSTAGKTSFMRAFMELDEKSIAAIGCDEFAEDRYADLLAEKFPDQYAILDKAIGRKFMEQFIRSPPEMLRANGALFTKECDTTEKQEAIFALKDKFPFADNEEDYKKGNVFKEIDLMNDLIPGSHKGEKQDLAHFEKILSTYDAGKKTVIFDTPNSEGFLEYLKGKYGDAYKKIPLQRFLVYVPLDALMDRLPKRNEEATRSGHVFDIREPISVLEQFMRTYRKSSTGELHVDMLKRKDIVAVFQKNQTTIAEDNKSRVGRGQDPITLESFLQHFGFESGIDEVSITNDYQKFDGIFRTANQSPATCAKELSDNTYEIWV